MRWKIIPVLFLAVTLGSCASKRHTSRGGDDTRTPDRKSPAPVSRSLDTEEYIRLYSSLAVEEMHRSGVPASITLAQGIHESGNGNSRLARQANNHFGIKCSSDWEGGKTYKDDDRRNECFRAYESVRDSYRDHSEFLQRSRYRFLFELDPTDYKGWAHGLKRAGYATNPRYPRLLIDVIERYELYRFDRADNNEMEKVLAENKEKPAPQVTPPADNSPVPDSQASKPAAISHYYYNVRAGDTLYSISRRFDISVEELREWNGLSSNSISAGQQLRVSR